MDTDLDTTRDYGVGLQRIFFSSDRVMFWCAEGLVVIPSILFYALVCIPLFSDSPLFFIFGVVLTTIICVFHFSAALSDPGIVLRAKKIPRNEQQATSTPASKNISDLSGDNITANENENENENDIVTLDSEQYTHTQSLVKNIVIEGMTIPIYFCTTCNVWRPPRAHHCRSCDNCIELFDHHCPWVANCVGRRNHRYFVMYLTTILITCLYMSSVSGYLIARITMKDGVTFPIALTLNPFPAIMFIYCIAIMLTLVYLFGYHWWLVLVSRTTYEAMKHVDLIHPILWDKGPAQNCYRSICFPLNPSPIKGRCFPGSREEEPLLSNTV